MMTGLLMFEWAWSKAKPIREVDEERDSKYPAFRRYDAKNWSRWKFYIGAMILLPLRLFAIVAFLIVLYIYLK